MSIGRTHLIRFSQKTIMTEHPKSAVHRYMAQNVDNPDAIQLVIDDVHYNHEHLPVDNKNIFTCIIQFSVDKNHHTITSGKFLTKKNAEKDAFDILYKLLQTKDMANDDSMFPKKDMVSTSADHVANPFKEKPMSKQKNRTEWKEDITGTDLTNTIVVIVDSENICKQSDINRLTSHLDQFMSQQQEINVRVVKVAGFCSSVKNTADIVIRSNRNDAVDHYISYLIGKLESNILPPKKIYIISRDKFGSCLQDFCNNVEHSSDVSDFISSFDQTNNFSGAKLN
jgi:hypothetical protein